VFYKLNLSDTSLAILNKRYLLRNESGELIETPEQMFRRVAEVVAAAEWQADDDDADDRFYRRAGEYYTVMTDLAFLPNSPCLAGAGRKPQQLSACYVCSIDDSLRSIFKTLTDAALISQGGGGVGFNFGNIRPKDDIVRSSTGVASGPVSFMKVYDAATDCIKQGSFRRGACMGILPISHPDIEEFITVKRTPGVLTNFNLSVGITDAFMKAVDDDADWDLINPRTNAIHHTVRARDLWSLIVESAWASGEPGVVFLDTVNATNPLPGLGRIEATNPCVTGDTLILTDRGYVRIDSVVGQKVHIWNGQEWSEVEPRQTGSNQPLMRVCFTDGSHIDCTPYHKFLIDFVDGPGTTRTKRVEAQDLVAGMRLASFTYPVIAGGDDGVDVDQKFAYALGFYAVDAWHAAKLLGYPPESHALIPDGTWSLENRLTWLLGLLDRFGCPDDSGIAIYGNDQRFLMAVKNMLHTLGAFATLVVYDADCCRAPSDCDKHCEDGGDSFPCAETCKLIISARSFARLGALGLMSHLTDAVDVVNCPEDIVRVASVSRLPYDASEVYCFTESKRHAGMFGSVITSNCGEQVLLPYQSCVLGSINLAKIVYSDGLTIKFDYLDQLVRTAVRFLNGVIDVSDYPIPEIAAMTRATRPIGLGIMGWADLLILAEIPYDSDTALDFAEHIMRRITMTAWDESRVLGELYGSFPALEYSIYAHDMRPPRNSTVTTCAPTGTISMIADCSSGIEPIFAVAYTKTVMDGTPFTYVNPYFKMKMQERGLWSDDLAAEVAKTGSVQHLDIVPDDIKRLFRTAHEIAPEWHVKMQAAFQKYVTSSISKTINLPNDATVDDVAHVYRMGWTRGCKGLTCFRDGSRDEQVLTVGIQADPQSTEDDAESVTASSSLVRVIGGCRDDGILEVKPTNEYVVIPRERPELTFGYTQKILTGCGQMYLTLNNDDDGYPCETFAYCSNGGCQGLTEGVSRLISLALRSGIPVEYIVDQLTDVRCPVATKKQTEIHNKSCPDAMGKALELFAEYCDEQRALSVLPVDTLKNCIDNNQFSDYSSFDGICPECGDVMTEESGCRICYSCGYSKCS